MARTRQAGRYFTLTMLERNCIVKSGIEGLDPDEAEDYQLKKWLRDHPEKRAFSEKEREKLARRLVASRG